MKFPKLSAKLLTSYIFVTTTLVTLANRAVNAEDCPDSGVLGNGQHCIQATSTALGFRIPTFSEILTFAIRAVFVFGGLAALMFLLLGAFAWITSGGDKDKVSEAQKKIQAAVLGVIMIAVVLAIVVTLEQVIFGGKICLGLSCPITIPTLVKPAPGT